MAHSAITKIKNITRTGAAYTIISFATIIAKIIPNKIEPYVIAWSKILFPVFLNIRIIRNIIVSSSGDLFSFESVVLSSVVGDSNPCVCGDSFDCFVSSFSFSFSFSFSCANAFAAGSFIRFSIVYATLFLIFVKKSVILFLY